MTATGLAFPVFEHIAFVLLVAFFGTINPSTGDIGVLVPLEHAMLAQGVADRGAHARVRALQPDRRACGRGRRARRRDARLLAHGRHRDTHGVQADVPRLRRARARRRGVLPAPAARRDARGRGLRRRSGPRAASVYKLAALFSIDSFAGGFVGAIAAGAVAVRAVRSLALGREPVLLLVEHARARSRIRSPPGFRGASG